MSAEGFWAWCAPASALKDQGPINYNDFPSARVVVVNLISDFESAIIIECSEGGTFGALVPNHGLGQNCFFTAAS